MTQPRRAALSVVWMAGLALVWTGGASPFLAGSPPAPAAGTQVTPAGAPPGPAVVLVTLDGARWQEVFGGLDRDVALASLRQGQRLEEHAMYRRFWAESPEERRRKLMPFLWDTLVQTHGSIAGHHAAGSRVLLTNRLRFSYPGYAELLLGRAHDNTITSNDPVRNPYPTVFEFVASRAPRAGVAVFASWTTFDAMVAHRAGAFTVNAGPKAVDSPDEHPRRLSALQFETPTGWDDVRHDAYTFHLAMDHLARHRPRVLYLAFDETDDWSHDGRYDRLLDAYARTDGYLKALWTWLQEQPDYRGVTSLIVTTDHGRGRTAADWRNHGAEVAGAEETWMAFASPRLARRGEWRDHPVLTTAQVAATIAAWMDLDWRAFDPAAAPPVR